MPRTRLVWHLFAGWCGLVAAGLVVVSWLASVELARLSDDGEYRRMEDLARMASESMPKDPSDSGALAAWQLSTQALSRSVGLQLELLAADGRLLLPMISGQMRRLHPPRAQTVQPHGEATMRHSLPFVPGRSTPAVDATTPNRESGC
jgi:4-amino-4-deoxy-L-arabinose transferase-like glycosyltransferase